MRKPENKETSQILVDAFKRVIEEKPFKDIIIKDITDEAGIFRATFYNYFEDKYALFDYIMYEELFSVVDKLIENNMISEGISLIFQYFFNNQKFYKRAFKYEGPNSCQEYLESYLKQYLMKILDTTNPKIKQEYHSIVTQEDFIHLIVALLKESIITSINSEDPIEHSSARYEALILFFTEGLKPFFYDSDKW